MSAWDKKKQNKNHTCIVLLFTCFVVLQGFFQASYAEQAAWSIDLSVQSAQAIYQEHSNNVFAPFEEINIIAKVMYNMDPRPGIGVSFEIRGPLNSPNQIVFFRSATTDEEGMATILFRIPMHNQTAKPVLGTWAAFSSTAAFDSKLRGNLTFEVKWPVEIRKISLLDSEGNEQNKLAREDTRIQLILRNTNMQSRDVNITVDLRDAFKMDIGQVAFQNMRLDNNTNTQIEHDLLIPIETAFGEATATCNVHSGSYNDTAIPIAGSRTVTFLIINRDVAIIEAHLSTDELYTGEPLHIVMKVANKGDDIETLHIQINHDSGFVGNLTTILAPLTDADLTYTWNTSDVIAGTYMFTVQIAKLPGEMELVDNEITAGTAKISYPPIYPHIVNLFVLLLIITALFTVSLLAIFLKNQRRAARKPTVKS